MKKNFIHTKYGWCYYCYIKKRAFIYNLYIHPKFRNFGKAKRLLEYIKNEIKEDGYSGEIEIEVRSRRLNIDKQRLTLFYKNMGFKIYEKKS
jgi:ribosomal protein S18 acetylase RimI-like enzyme